MAVGVRGNSGVSGRSDMRLPAETIHINQRRIMMSGVRDFLVLIGKNLGIRVDYVICISVMLRRSCHAEAFLSC